MESQAEILIVDDEVEICLHIQEMFGFEGMKADYAVQAKEGLEKLDSGHYRLALIDIKLGGMISGRP